MRRYRKAFTLVELLVVVSIIGLLLGMVLPSVGRARQIAARAVCATNLHGLAPAFRMYLNESNDVMPVAAQMPRVVLPRSCTRANPFSTAPRLRPSGPT